MATLDLPVRSLDEYRRLAHIGRGTYGEVFLCERVATGERVCLKEIDLTFRSPDERTRCLNEVALPQELPAHPNIVKFCEAFWAHSTEPSDLVLVLILEHADAGDLEHQLKTLQGPMLEHEARRIFAQLVHGVHHLHAHRVVHRDVKCANVFLFQSGRVVLGDFGTSKLLVPSSGSDQVLEAQALSSTVVGSPLYMSPELLEGEPHGLATDIWSLGCVLYELLSGGKPAFAAASYPAVVLRITQGEYEPLDTAAISSQARDLVSRMLRKTPQERPSITEVLQSPWLQIRGTTEDRAAASLARDTIDYPPSNLPSPAPSRRNKAKQKSAIKKTFPSPPRASELRSPYRPAHSLQRHKDVHARQNEAASPLIRLDVQPPPPPVLPSRMRPMVPFKHYHQHQVNNSAHIEPLTLEVRGVRIARKPPADINPQA